MGMVSFFLFSFLVVGVASGQRMQALWDLRTSSQDPALWWHGKKAGKGEKRTPECLVSWLCFCVRDRASLKSQLCYTSPSPSFSTEITRSSAEVKQSIPKLVLRGKLGTCGRGSVFIPNQPQIQMSKSTDLCPITTPVVLLE